MLSYTNKTNEKDKKLFLDCYLSADWITWMEVSNNSELNERLIVTVNGECVDNVCRYNNKSKQICSVIAGDYIDLNINKVDSFKIYDNKNNSVVVEW